MEPHPLFSKNTKVGQLELFRCHMPQEFIDSYAARIKDYKRVQKRIHQMSVSLYEMNLPQYKAKVSKKVGLVNLNAYRIEKEWADLKKETEDFIAEQAKYKEHLDKWFTNFAELLDLRNEKYEPMGYY